MIMSFKHYVVNTTY